MDLLCLTHWWSSTHNWKKKKIDEFYPPIYTPCVLLQKSSCINQRASASLPASHTQLAEPVQGLGDVNMHEHIWITASPYYSKFKKTHTHKWLQPQAFWSELPASLILTQLFKIISHLQHTRECSLLKKLNILFGLYRCWRRNWQHQFEKRKTHIVHSALVGTVVFALSLVLSIFVW